MNDLQKKLKDMAVVFIADQSNDNEHILDNRIKKKIINDSLSELCMIPTFMKGLSGEEMREVRDAIEADLTFKIVEY